MFSKTVAAHCLLIVAALMWGGAYVVGKYGLAEGSAIWLTFLRWAPGTVVIFMLVRKNVYKKRAYIYKNLLTLVLLSSLGIVLYPLTMFLALADTSALNASLYLAVSPVFIVLLTGTIFREKITITTVIASILSFIGVLVLLAQGDITQITSLSINWADRWAVLSAIIWCFYCVLLRLKPTLLSELEFLACICIIGTVLLILSAVLSGNYEVPIPQNQGIFWSFVYFAIAPSILAFFFWNSGTRILGSVTAAPYTNLVPFFGGVMGIAFLKEKIGQHHIVGGLLIIASITLIIYSSYKSKGTENNENNSR